MNYLCIDIGTTRCKGRLYGKNGEILYEDGTDYPLAYENGESYVNIPALRGAIRAIIKGAAKAASVGSIAFSSIGESFVLLDKDDNILVLPMLYTDARGESEAKEASENPGGGLIYGISGVMPQAMYSAYKLLWIKKNRPELFAGAEKLMLVGEYFGYLLTGARAIDYGLASRTGVFDIREKKFSSKLCEALGIPCGLFSKPLPSGSVVAEILPELANELGLSDKCVLVLGSHDQICAAVGAGAVNAGDCADGMGTVECVTGVFKDAPYDEKFGEMGYPCVPFYGGLYCTYALSYSCGSAVEWFKNRIAHGYKGSEDSFFAYVAKKYKTDNPLLVLPYFAGAATPYQDINARGALFGLSLSTDDAQIYYAILEGCCYEVRLNLERLSAFGVNIKSTVVTGGCSHSDEWMQMKADITGLCVSTLKGGEGGLCGLAAMQAVAMHEASDISQAVKIFTATDKTFYPSANTSYENKYKKYKKLYQLTKEL